MSEHDARIRVDGVDWPALLPWMALFRSPIMALHPAKLLPALGLVALLYAGGLLLDVVWGAAAPAGTYEAYRGGSAERYDQVFSAYRQAGRSEAVADGHGIFRTLLDHEQAAFARLLRSAVALELGIGDFLAGRGSASRGVMGALVEMGVTIPAWFVRTQPAFALVYLAWAFIVTVLLGGTIARLAALHACINRRGSLRAALRFVVTRYPWFFLAPLTPAMLVAVVALVIMVAGLLFNVPGLDVLAALGYGLMLVGGLVAAVLLVGLATAGHLLLPALAVEGTDAFDAISRAYNYTLGRPLRYLFYSFISLVYGAAVYLALSLLLLLVLWLTWMFASQWVFAEAGDSGVNRFDAMLAPPRALDLTPAAAPAELGMTSQIASTIMQGWVTLLAALLPAFAISLYFCATTWIYLLLRRAADGTGFDDIFILDGPGGGGSAGTANEPPEKVEPVA